MRQTSTSAILPGENDSVPSVTNHIEKYGSTANGEIATTEPVANGHAIDDTDKNVQQNTGHGKQGTGISFCSNMYVSAYY